MAIEGRRRPVVLVVEDDLLIRMSAADMVESADCIAVEAANADEAVSILEARSDISVVFTDIQMPGSMDGLKLAAAVRDRWPPIKIIATSGQVRVDGDMLPSGGRFLPKPYSAREVAMNLKELIGFDTGTRPG
jgi:CheY-like chemotaxis protein